VLIDGVRSVFDPADVAAGAGAPDGGSRLRRFLPELSVNLAAPSNYARLRELLRRGDGPATVLVVGGGDGGAGITALADDAIRLVSTDVRIGPATDLAADAHQLPFADGTFDAVVAQAVLEHVADPWQCVEELHRVLRPDGLVYAETPFMQQVHLGRYDFTRFTALGHRRLFRRFEQLDAGVAVGAGSALAWSLTYFLTSFARTRQTRRALYAMGAVLFAWLRTFDRWLTTDAAVDAAAGCYFLGRRSDRTLSDAELITQYRGGLGR
jgi:SAM-dependent methyltransferase